MNKTSSSRFLVSTMVTATRMRMSTKPKAPSHYDTLEINSRATQGEIKSAYFELSKQYHPDKNKSVEASKKFRDISEAYEVLGNFNSRKIYDRSLIIKPRHEKQYGKSTTMDPKIKYYQTQAALFKQDTKSGSTPVYDFDEWTRAHYGKTLKRNIQDKKEAQQLRELRQHFENPTPSSASQEQSFLFVSILFIASLLFLSMNKSQYDNVFFTVWEEENLEKDEISEKSDATANSVSSD